MSLSMSIRLEDDAVRGMEIVDQGGLEGDRARTVEGLPRDGDRARTVEGLPRGVDDTQKK